MTAAPLTELSRTVFAERSAIPDGVAVGKAYGNLAITLERYVSDEIRLCVRGDGPSILVVTNAFASAWTAEIDGVRTPIFPTDHAFWGIHVPDGARSVVFRYELPYR